MVIGKGQQGQEASTLDGRGQLALVFGAGASDPSGDDLAGLGHVVAQGVDVFVIDLINALGGELADALALEQSRLGITLGAFLVKGFLGKGQLNSPVRTR